VEKLVIIEKQLPKDCRRIEKLSQKKQGTDREKWLKKKYFVKTGEKSLKARENT
jgi:hypothetical protein